MSRTTRVIALAGAAYLLLDRLRRTQQQAPERPRAALPGRRTALPSGVQEFPPQLVDHRHTVGVPVAAPAHATDAVEITGEYYRDHPQDQSREQPSA